jgi:hypothetical protein
MEDGQACHYQRACCATMWRLTHVRSLAELGTVLVTRTRCKKRQWKKLTTLSNHLKEIIAGLLIANQACDRNNPAYTVLLIWEQHSWREFWCFQ